MAAVKLPLPAYLPDQSANSGVLLEANGVIPRVDGFGPIGAFLAISSALPATFRGGAACIATNGTSYLFAGTANGLSRYSAGGWTSLLTAMSVTEQWRFVTFGNYAVAVNGVETKVVDLSAGTASALAGAPAGKVIAVIGDYVVIGQAAGDLTAIYTSKANDHTGWNILDGATVQPMLAGGEVMGLAGGEYGVILQRQRLVRMNLTGDGTAPFSYDPITDNVGCASKASVCSYGRTVFFLSDNGFMALEDGQALRPIGSEKVDRTFMQSLPPEEYERIFSAVDPKTKTVRWVVPGSPGRVWIYNYELDKWSTDTPVIDGLFAGFTSSQTLEQVSATYPDLDAMPYSLDDPRFSGGSPQLYAVQDGAIGIFSGSPRKASFQYGFGEFVQGRIARFRGVRPVTDCVAGQTVTLDLRDRQGDAATTRACGPLRASGIMPVRGSGRYAKPRWEIEAGATWSYAQGLEFEFEAGGIR